MLITIFAIKKSDRFWRKWPLKFQKDISWTFEFIFSMARFFCINVNVAYEICYKKVSMDNFDIFINSLENGLWKSKTQYQKKGLVESSKLDVWSDFSIHVNQNVTYKICYQKAHMENFCCSTDFEENDL